MADMRLSLQEVTMDFRDRRLWYGLAAVIVLIAIAYGVG